ncbi:MAG: DUF2135 domain-containing protein [Lentisphaeria bacterium]|nr:DUF2135 domain-containing protein [Lentisphaeria bacterium]
MRLLLTLLLNLCAFAEVDRPPVIYIEKNMKPLTASKVDIKVRVYGFISETEITMTFHNPQDRQLGGDLYLPMPAGALVSGYALDIDNKMIEGVVLEKAEAREIFEKEVRKGVDPGLVEFAKGNTFKTRVFPILPQKTRTVQVTYISEIIGESLTVPIQIEHQLEEFNVEITVQSGLAKPVLKSDMQNLTFTKKEDQYIAASTLKNQQPPKKISVILPRIQEQNLLVEESSDGYKYFVYRPMIKVPALQKDQQKLTALTILWDVSSSREYADHQQELALLEAYLKTNMADNFKLEIATFSNTVHRTEVFENINLNDVKAPLEFIKSVAYDGGTQMSSIAEYLNQDNAILLFSDGLGNLGDNELQISPKFPIFTINSSVMHDPSYLKTIAAKSNGVFLNLTKREKASLSTIVAQLQQDSYQYIPNRNTEVLPQVPTQVSKDLLVVGRTQKAFGKITNTFSYASSGQQTTEILPDTVTPVPGDLLRRYWGQTKVQELMLNEKKNHEVIITLAKEYELVTPFTSMLVLETLEQYVEHQVTPPKTWPEMYTKYQELMQNKKVEEEQVYKRNIKEVYRKWLEKLAYHEKKFEFKKYKKAGTGHDGFGGPAPSEALGGERARAAESQRLATRAEMRMAQEEVVEEELIDELAFSDESDIEASAPGRERLHASSAEIEIAVWDPNTPYLKKLKATKENWYGVYLKEKATYGKSPGFYLDCANFFIEKKERETAIRILSNIAELELENPAMLRILAHRFQQIKEYKLAISLFAYIKTIREEEPQSYRDYALALIAYAQELENQKHDTKELVALYSQALMLLKDIIIREWDRFEEIELIALNELNNIYPKAEKLGLAYPLDQGLNKPLELDMRITLTWDQDMTDMDLWVIEPSTQKCYYSDNRSQIGGYMSRDFTTGYGPEVYTIKDAMPGEYQIQINYYGNNSNKLTGVVTVQATLYTNWGKENQEKKEITLRLEGEEKVINAGKININN